MLDDPENQRLLAHFKLACNPHDSLAWASLLHSTTGVGSTFIDTVYESAREAGTTFGEALLAARESGFADFTIRVPSGTTRPVDETRGWLTELDLPLEMPEEGWGRWMVSVVGETDHLDISDELEALLCSVDENIRECDLAGYLGQLRPLSKDQAQAKSAGVRIMTMAASKGLTVTAAIVTACEEGITPSYRPGVDINEERRLLYVAMTRAKKYLYCTWAQRRTGPTARSGASRVQNLRNPSSFFDGGPIQNQDGLKFIARRWLS